MCEGDTARSMAANGPAHSPPQQNSSHTVRSAMPTDKRRPTTYTRWKSPSTMLEYAVRQGVWKTPRAWAPSSVRRRVDVQGAPMIGMRIKYQVANISSCYSLQHGTLIDGVRAALI